MAGYLQRRRSLAGLVLVMDIRHPLTAFDSRMLAWCRQASLPLLLLLTKADKLGRGSARTQLERVKGVVAGEPGQVEAELFSAQAHQGVESVHALLDQWLALDGIEDGF
jgi:GTP-binding protein